MVQGAAYSPVFKAIATVIVFGSVAWFAHLWLAGKATGGAVSILTWFVGGLAMMGYTWWCLVRSVTRIDAEAIEQSWMWRKRIPLRDLAYGKLIRVRGFEWLVAPRLYVRTLLGKFAVFHAADPVLLADFERLVAELKAFRSIG